MLEHGASNDQVVEGAELSESLSILILDVNSMFSHDEFSVGVVCPHFCVEITH